MHNWRSYKRRHRSDRPKNVCWHRPTTDGSRKGRFHNANPLGLPVEHDRPVTAVHVEESRVGHTPRNGHSKAQLTKAVENLRSHLCFWKKYFGIILHKPYPNMKGIFRNQRSGMPSLPPRTTPSWEVTSQILNTSRGNEINQSTNFYRKWIRS